MKITYYNLQNLPPLPEVGGELCDSRIEIEVSDVEGIARPLVGLWNITESSTNLRNSGTGDLCRQTWRKAQWPFVLSV